MIILVGLFDSYLTIIDSPSPLDQIRPPLDFRASSRQNDVNLAYNKQK